VDSRRSKIEIRSTVLAGDASDADTRRNDNGFELEISSRAIFHDKGRQESYNLGKRRYGQDKIENEGLDGSDSRTDRVPSHCG
jgi:hypothetical protein